MKNANCCRGFSPWAGVFALLGLLLLMAANGNALAANVKRSANFDHVKTGFPLTGAHVKIPCETCHVQGNFKGTPKKCATCHAQGSRIPTTTFKSAKHLVSADACDKCHTSTASWNVVFFSHAGVVPHKCTQCHNNSVAKGKPANHTRTDEACDVCHRTTTWMSASFTHVSVKPGSCVQCHVQGGTAKTYKRPDHIPTSLSCDACHTTGGSFGTSRFTHSPTQGVAAGQCSGCHDGTHTSSKALGKAQAVPAHVATSESCDSCHAGYASFAGANAHKGVTASAGTCANSGCHVLGGAGKPKPAGNAHIPTTKTCNLCHGMTTFTPSTFTHSTTQGVVAGQCETCHNGTYASLKVRGKAQASPPHVTTSASCDTCHKNFVTFAGANSHNGVVASAGTCANSGCHGPGGAGMPKPTGNGHIPTSLTCNGCHNMTTFNPPTFTHATTQGVIAGQCENCHNGNYAALNVLGKAQAAPPHIATTASCDTCHKNYASFAGASAHTGVIASAGTCANSGCHGPGGAGMPKPTGNSHIPTSLTCNWCHNMTSFFPPTFTHSTTQGVVAGQCETCHNGNYAALNVLGKAQATPPHIITSASCDTCHKNYVSFTGAMFNHTGVALGSCANAGCHTQGGSGKLAPDNHIPYQSQLLAGAGMSCDACHTSTTSFTAVRMNHNNSQGSGAGWCKGCHATGTNFLGTMLKKQLNHYERYQGQTDCSSSGCHRPLGTNGTPYSRWTS